MHIFSCVSLKKISGKFESNIRYCVKINLNKGGRGHFCFYDVLGIVVY